MKDKYKDRLERGRRVLLQTMSYSREDHLFIDDLPTVRRDERRDTEVTIEFSIVSAYSSHILENIS